MSSRRDGSGFGSAGASARRTAARVAKWPANSTKLDAAAQASVPASQIFVSASIFPFAIRAITSARDSGPRGSPSMATW